jgi:hypothetical protein
VACTSNAKRRTLCTVDGTGAGAIEKFFVRRLDNMIASKEEIAQCAFSEWFSLVPTGKTFKSRVITLPRNFVEYLGEDGVHLPVSSKGYFNRDALSDDEEDRLKEVDLDEEDLPAHNFPDLDVAIATAIEQLGGEVMVKLNWSSPLDAVWMNAGTLKCRNPSEVYLLLKSSDRIVFDLEHMYDLCKAQSTPAESTLGIGTDKDQVTLVLRKWANLNPAMEFRFFVQNKRILGICQRDCTTYYDFLEEKLDEIQDLVYAFYNGQGDSCTPGSNTSSIRDIFPLAHYTMDIYVDKRDRVWLVDFNPFGEPTCSLLFEWEELCTISDELIRAEVSCEPQLCEFRIVENSASTLQSTKGSTRGPIDVHAATDFHKFMELCKAQRSPDDNSSGDET